MSWNRREQSARSQKVVVGLPILLTGKGAWVQSPLLFPLRPGCQACPILIILPPPHPLAQMTPRFLAPALPSPQVPGCLRCVADFSDSLFQLHYSTPGCACLSTGYLPPSLTKQLKTNQKNHPCFLPSPQILQNLSHSHHPRFRPPNLSPR